MAKSTVVPKPVERDAALDALEAALEDARARSKQADEQLRDLQTRELAIAREVSTAPVGPPSAAMPVPTSGWTIDTALSHVLALRQADERFYAERYRSEEKFQNERDRRLTEVAIEREKALKIKETADLAALSLARDIQIYKDEKANELRAQIEGERGLYATNEKVDGLVSGLGEKIDSATKPMNDFLAAQIGRELQTAETRNRGADGRAKISTATAVIASVLGSITILTGIYAAIQLSDNTPATPVVVTVKQP